MSTISYISRSDDPSNDPTAEEMRRGGEKIGPYVMARFLRRRRARTRDEDKVRRIPHDTESPIYKKALRSNANVRVYNPLIRLEHFSVNNWVKVTQQNCESNALSVLLCEMEVVFEEEDHKVVLDHKTFTMAILLFTFELYRMHLQSKGWNFEALIQSRAAFELTKMKVYRAANSLMSLDVNMSEDFFDAETYEELKRDYRKI
ncbi:hypothetical protein Pcinc_002072 [Petrolisthes cinctipes]|uniref:Uncharacterized protein n=1 Tax=Petrolisthes cinctipes TaxID=88211 RepID=A0AAE1GJH9_PETCI|nr:hypothetical protein Pcinc_002072 [Petrolisthes cinctipes]